MQALLSEDSAWNPLLPANKEAHGEVTLTSQKLQPGALHRSYSHFIGKSSHVATFGYKQETSSLALPRGMGAHISHRQFAISAIPNTNHPAQTHPPAQSPLPSLSPYWVLLALGLRHTPEPV